MEKLIHKTDGHLVNADPFALGARVEKINWSNGRSRRGTVALGRYDVGPDSVWVQWDIDGGVRHIRKEALYRIDE